MRPFVIFYHLGQLNDWEEIYLEQMERLSSLIQSADALYIHINGDEDLSMVPAGAVIVRNSDHLLEADTLVAIRKHAERNPGHDILYLHSKGVTKFDREEAVWENVTAWRKYLEKCVIDESDFCRTKLAEGYSACGPMIQRCSTLLEASTQKIFPSYTPHFAGNFWWASASHIKSLPMEILYEEWRNSGHARFQSERWIGAGPSELTTAYDMGGPRTINPYYTTPEQWEGDMDWSPRICVLVMFANESKVLRRMLDSTLGYGHYYVFQDNGSTDGSDQIARDFLAENNLEGYLYYCEEGWVNFGWNRDHVLQTAKKSDHNCDWFMKMDCDEMLRIDENNFDWQWLRDLSMPAWNLLAYAGDSVYDRTWMWQTGYDWAFNNDPAHETIRCDDMMDGEKENFPSTRLPGFGHTCTTETRCNRTSK